MYKSPIDIITGQLQIQMEGHIMKAVQDVIGVDVDKEELIRALRYDRYQYEKGFRDGVDSVLKHGRWYRTGAENVYGGIEIQCSECGHTFMTSPGHIEEEHFCCNCGAKMDGAKDG